MRKIKFFFLIFLFLFLIGGIIIKWGKIKNFECREEENLCQEELKKELGSFLLGKNFLFFSSSKLRTEILNRYPLIKEIEVKKKFPWQLEIKIKKRQPMTGLAFSLNFNSESTPSAFLKWEIEEGIFLIDNEGVILEKKEKTDLPLILLKEKLNLSPGEKIKEEKIVKGVKILEKMRLRLLEPKISYFSSQFSFTVWLKEGVFVLFSLEKDIDYQLDSLQFILSQSKIKMGKIKKIDLRFDKPVISYE
ncbi:MAG: cell division protein FtsQ/DivIB [Microgenomates group bacterium]